MSYYQKHIFICTNVRDNGKKCCGEGRAQELFEYAKSRMQQLQMHGKNMVRVNKAGCLDRCALGPVLVIYPEAVWYAYQTQEDIDEIIDEHVINGRVVTRLMLED